MTLKVGINGMGRIGRMVIRAIIESQNKNIEIKHINNRSNAESSCTLIKYDSVHGKFNAELEFDEKHLIINKNKITFSQHSNIEDIGIAFESSLTNLNVFKSGEKLEFTTRGTIGKSANTTISEYGFDLRFKFPKLFPSFNLKKIIKTENNF